MIKVYINASVGIYTLIRDINNLLETIPMLNTSNDKKTLLEGEAAFLRAYTYFALANAVWWSFDYQESSGV